MIEGLVGSHPGVAAVAALYAVALLVSAPAALARRRGAVLAGFALFSVAFLANTVVILLRWAEAGRPPFKTLFETMVFYPWCVALVTLILVGLHRLFVLVPFSSAVGRSASRVVPVAGTVSTYRPPSRERSAVPSPVARARAPSMPTPLPARTKPVA